VPTTGQPPRWCEGLYGITPDGQAVARYDGTGTSWKRIGGPTERLYAGRYGLFATAPGSGDVSRYVNGRWEVIGAAGRDFAVTNESVYGISVDGQGSGVMTDRHVLDQDRWPGLAAVR
jgi:hypothetical protein